jgi:hypothetical protein
VALKLTPSMLYKILTICGLFSFFCLERWALEVLNQWCIMRYRSDRVKEDFSLFRGYIELSIFKEIAN